MSRGYGKYRRGTSSHSSFHFDNLFKENSNRPSAARSAATVGKWGITSFTSIRTANGKNEHKDYKKTQFDCNAGLSRTENEPEAAPKPKKFFKSRDSEPPDLTQQYSSRPSAAKRPKTVRKFFPSKDDDMEDDVDDEKTALNSFEKKSEKPPIVLRICRGKSQLLNDSDESESTPTPSSTPSTSTVTSPRALRDNVRPTNCRITRSARRSMQQDPSSSPATADTPSEFSLFTSPKKDIDLSPQYIPAEKYELERRAMYDNLLRPNSPTNQSTNDDCIDLPPLLLNESQTIDTVPSLANLQDDIDVPPPSPPILPVVDSQEVEEPQQIDPPEPIVEEKQQEIVSDDEDSNSTAPIDQKLNPIEEHKDEILEKILEKPTEPPPAVKLVISKKKGSIFKSRALVDDDGSKKRRALYKHKWSSDDKDAVKSTENISSVNNVTDEFGFSDEPLTRITASDENADISSVKCMKSDKGYYTVVRNVKKAHQIQEIGEFQEFNDDVEYILDALQDNNPISTRCLSAITLASKCMVPAFRMHVRAHGTVAKFFKALHDATKDPSLGLCTATVMFVLSQDRLNMDLDRDCLELMLNLLESDVSYQQALDVCGLSAQQLEKNKQKVRELCGEIQSQGHAMHLNLENITTGQLAMETLLSLTSKRAGEWFKEELRELGGLEHIMKTISECCRQVSDYVVSWTDVLLDKLKKVDRCLRVLENVTHNNEENQTYLLKHNNGDILDTLVNLYKLCDREIPLYPVTDISDKISTGTIIREALLVTLKVLINLTHHFNKQSMGNVLIGSRPGIIDTSLHLLLQVPHYIPEQKKFELGVLVLMLLINLIQDQDFNKKQLIDAKAPSKLESIYSREESAVEALIAQFYHWEGCAKIAEKKTNAILDGEKDGDAPEQHKSNEEFIEETVAKLLQKAGTHMEYTFLASYIVMLIGFLIMDNVDYQNAVRNYLKGNNFADMVELLKKFFNFMNLTASTEASSVCAIKATQKVISFLEECDKPSQVTAVTSLTAVTTASSSNFTECMDLSYRMT